MPRLGLGTFLVVDEQIIQDMISQALKNGYRHFDTAQMYRNHVAIGKALAASGIPRDELFITTKQLHHMSEADAKLAFEQTLKDLKTDYIDLYLIHWPNHDPKVNQATWRFFESLYEAKKVRAIGVSNFSIHHLEDLLSTAKIKPQVNQVELHPGLNQRPLQKYLIEKEIAIESYGPFMRGHLFEPPYVETLTALANKYQKSINQIVIAWGLAKDVIMIPKSQTPSRIRENFAAQEIALDPEDIKTIDRLNRGTRVYTDPDNNPWGPLKPFDSKAKGF